MTDIRIEWLTDTSECDQAGCSGGWAEGARVYFDGELALDLEPAAHCYDSVSYSNEEVFARILSKLGHNLTESIHD